MPSKGRQRASRQSQLKSRKRKTSKNSNVFDSRDTITESKVSANPDNSPTKESPISKQTATQTPTRSIKGGTLSYEHLSAELRQIGIVASLIVAIILVISFSPIF